MNWTEAPWLGLDTETTGANPAHDRLVSAALVLRRGGASEDGPDEPRAWLADPGVPIPEDATRIHGISTETARSQGRPVIEVLDEVADALVAHWLQGCPVVIFNAPFDLTVLNSELRRHQLGSLEERLGGAPAPVIDPLVLDHALDRYRKGKRTLAAMTAAYGAALSERAHTAEADVTMMLDVLAAMAARYPQAATMNAAQLHEYQVAEHRKWADNFGSWLRSKGKPDDVSRAWPQE
ncbi:exonuclease domain-containing protein [Acidipropionibacterium virtanenii]|uniref:DNA polymerase III PolC-type n=1 Tax=Acidipropionibacterium virtanenii TaxID=2057246 RepID=A0A344UXQ4_9ACTN|nr:exonuclease domain-containing protein [Acidipropionibacterium virtanenii]AXE40052.1 DNA polymerase III PolC-type [Acidipropionibacterium virtanenii]